MPNFQGTTYNSTDLGSKTADLIFFSHQAVWNRPDILRPGGTAVPRRFHRETFAQPSGELRVPALMCRVTALKFR